MNVTDWAMIWRWVLLFGVSVFALLAILVTIGGALDVRKMLAELKRQGGE